MEGNFCRISVELLFVKPHWHQSYSIFSSDGITSENVKSLFNKHVLELKKKHSMGRSGCSFELYYHLDKKDADDAVTLIPVYKRALGESLSTLKRFLYLY